MRTATSFLVRPLPPAALDAVRRTGRDAAGRPAEALRAGGGEPLRCCLRDAGAGEDLLLFGYAPPVAAGPYREIGPVFAHAGSCPGPDQTGGYPAAWRDRPQVLRAYDRRGRIHGGRRHDGTDPEGVIAELFADPEVHQLHSRNVVYGCFMFTVDRPGE
ncbi:DUF1203 domain-containing protein [Micromonospora sp. WMMD812]|uniref:DUF1203 domain-containing protein n=1 Tax=Micromonospora sp. WMMD812 TaxID=3015152 RepID=UPI00248B7198|nr:DUF1203 domain-containing protein [Micromonospora sp. WMMD812]WBB68991.1 DUF1203 domain-containing protein [Micromonospora sp. WMMD812]